MKLGPLKNLFKFPIVQVHEITSRLKETPSGIELLCEVTAQFDDLHLLKHVVQAGWPSHMRSDH